MLKLFLVSCIALFLGIFANCQNVIGISKGAPDVLGLVYSMNTQTGEVETVKRFGDNIGAAPSSAVIIGNIVYGVTWRGGNNNDGLIFSYNTQTQEYKKLFDFDQFQTGFFPDDLTIGNNGKIYGICGAGGTQSTNTGTAWEFDTVTNSFRVLIVFANSYKGKRPRSICIDLASNTLYGVTGEGGTYNKGAVFKYDIDEDAFLSVYSHNNAETATSEWLRGECEYYNGFFYTFEDGSNHRLFRINLSNQNTYTIDNYLLAPTVSFESLFLKGTDLYYTASEGTGNKYLKKYNILTDVASNVGVIGTGYIGLDQFWMEGDELYYRSNNASTGSNCQIAKVNVNTMQVTNLYSYTVSASVDDNFVVSNGSDLVMGTYNDLNNNYLFSTQDRLIHYSITNSQLVLEKSLKVTPDGSAPDQYLTKVGNKFWGACDTGGDNNEGCIFSIDVCSHDYKIEGSFNWADGAQIMVGSSMITSTVVYPGTGTKMYMTTNIDGLGNRGLLISYDTLTKAFNTLYNFGLHQRDFARNLIYNPNDGMLYGHVRPRLGTQNFIVFKYDIAQSIYQEVNVGAFVSSLFLNNSEWTLHSDGMCYGFMNYSDTYTGGLIYKFNPGTSAITILHTALSLDVSGYYFSGIPVINSNNEIMGVSSGGGALGGGVIFKFSLSTNTYTPLLEINPIPFGSNSQGGLTQIDSDRYFFSTTSSASGFKGAALEYRHSTNTLRLLKVYEQYYLYGFDDPFNLGGSDVEISANNTSVCSGQSVILTTNFSAPGIWEPGEITAASIDVNPNSDMTYTYTGTDELGCSAVDSLEVQTYSLSFSGEFASCQPINADVCAVVEGNDFNDSTPFFDPQDINNSTDDYVIQVLQDHNGNSFVLGQFIGTINIGGMNLTSNANTYDGYLAKLNASGEAQWVKAIGGNNSNNTDVMNQLHLDDAGDAYVSGRVYGSFNFGPASATGTIWNPFVAKYLSSNGTCQWAKTGTSTVAAIGFQRFYSLNGDLYALGAYQTGFTFNGYTPPSTGTNSVNLNSILIKFNSTTGALQWTKTSLVNTASGNLILPYGITSGNTGEIVVAASAAGLNPIAFGNITINASSTGSLVFLKYNASTGIEISATLRANNSSTDGAVEVTNFYRLCNGDYLLAGKFSNGVFNFGNQSLINPQPAMGDVYVMRMTPSFDPIWMRGGGSMKADNPINFTVSEDLNKFALVVSGYFDFNFENKKLFGDNSSQRSVLITGDVDGNIELVSGKWDENIDLIFATFNHSVTGLLYCGYVNGIGSLGTHIVGGSAGLNGFLGAIGSTENFSVLWSPAQGLNNSNSLHTTLTASALSDYSIAVSSPSCSFNTLAALNLIEGVQAGPDVSICNGETAQLTASNTTGSFFWSPSSSLSSTSIVNPTASPDVTTNYIITRSLSNCISTDTVQVSVLPVPLVGVVVSDSSLCVGESAILNGSGASTYQWNNGVVNGLSFSPINGTTYSVIGTAANGCQNASSITLSVFPLPDVSAFATDNELCFGQQTTLSGSGASSYTWNGSAQNGIAFTPTQTSTYTVNGTDPNGCVNSDSIEIIVHPLPVIDVTASSTDLCSGENVVLSAIGANSPTWSNGVVNNQAFVPSVSQVYTATGVNSFGCSGAASLMVNVHPIPEVIIQVSDTEICNGESLILSGNGADSYIWSNGVLNGESFVPGSTQSYSVEGSSLYGCPDSAEIEIIVHPLPEVGFTTSTNEVCEFGEVIFSGTGASSYIWNNGAINNVPFAAEGDGNYTVTGTDMNGCSNTANIQITILAAPSLVVSPNTIAVCEGEMIALSASSDGSITWSDGIIEDIDFLPINNYTYYVSALAENGCESEVSILSQVYPLPEISIEASGNEICSGNSVLLTAVGAVSYMWQENILNGIAFIPDQSSTYHVIGTDANNCSSNAEINIEVNPSPVITIILSDDSLCLGESITLFAEGALTYNWSQGSTTSEITLTPGTNMVVSVEGTNEFDCTSSVSVDIIIQNCQGVDQINFDGLEIELFPNPATDGVSIRSTERFTFELLNTMGQVIQVGSFKKNTHYLDIKNEAPGTYFVRCNTANGIRMIKLIHID
jgi:hypothetical protein